MTAYIQPSKTDQWATPQALFDELSKEFDGFTLDVAADATNAKCERYYTREQDGLKQPWTGKIWCNPPYGRVIKDWIAKGKEAADNGATVVFLVPARTDTRWFHEIVLPHAEIRFIKGRIKFGDSKVGAPFPSMLVVFRP